LEVYKKLLKKGGRIIQKTDDRDFFDFSLEEYKAVGLKLESVSYNLHEKGNPEWNIVTEYEQKWVERGFPIHRVVAVKKLG
jgi:tRNA (guanine-N7-)-methyltransferase